MKPNCCPKCATGWLEPIVDEYGPYRRCKNCGLHIGHAPDRPQQLVEVHPSEKVLRGSQSPFFNVQARPHEPGL